MKYKSLLKMFLFLGVVFTGSITLAADECELSELSNKTFHIVEELDGMRDLSLSAFKNQDIDGLRNEVLGFYKRELNLQRYAIGHVLVASQTEVLKLIDLIKETPIPSDWTSYIGARGRNQLLSGLTDRVEQGLIMKPCEARKALEVDSVYPYLEGLEFKVLKEVSSVSFRTASFLSETMTLGGDYHITVDFTDGTSADWRIDNNLPQINKFFTGVL